MLNPIGPHFLLRLQLLQLYLQSNFQPLLGLAILYLRRKSPRDEVSLCGCPHKDFTHLCGPASNSLFEINSKTTSLHDVAQVFLLPPQQKKFFFEVKLQCVYAEENVESVMQTMRIEAL
jgi:hypothetical protein